MSVKFNRAAGAAAVANATYYKTADSAALTLPAAGWAISWTMVIDGDMTGANPQWIFSTGAFSAAGSIQASLESASAGTVAFRNRLRIYTTNSSANGFAGTNEFTSGAWLCVLQSDGVNLTLRSCPVLATLPSNSAAVRTEFTVDAVTAKTNAALDGPTGLYIGGRADLNVGRFFDQSLQRLVCVHGTLTDLEVARLAYGMQLSDLGRAPAWGFNLSTPTDTSDIGPSALTLTPNGALVAGTSPAYGYNGAAPLAPPTITGTPVINGTPAVGVASSYTPAAVDGNPIPTTTQQWTLDGVDISGATGSTYTPVTADATKALRVRQIATNSQGNTSATSSPVTVPAPAASSLSINPMPADRIYPRNGSAATVVFSGTYSGTAPTGVEVQLYAENGSTVLSAWAALTGMTISGGNWSGSLSVPQGGMYRAAARSGSQISAIDTNLFGVGALFGVIGSSSARLSFLSNGGTGYTPAANVRRYNQTAWESFGTDGSAVLLANDLAQRLGVPVGLFDNGVSGTNLNGWSSKQSNSGWTAFAAAVAANGARLEGCYITVGSNDAAAGTVVSKEDHLSKMRTMIANVRTLTGQTAMPICWSGSNRRPGNDARAQMFDWIHQAENEIGDDAGVTHVQTLDLLLSSDGVHLAASENGYPDSMRRTAYQWGERLVGGVYRRGPAISTMVADGNDVIVTLNHRGSTDFTPATGITGFTADTSVVSASRASANTIRVVCAAPPTSLKYLAGASPAVGTPVYGNTYTPLPMVTSTEAAILQEQPPADTTAPVLSGAISTSNISASGATLSWPAATDNVAVTGYEYSINGGSSYIDNTSSRTVVVTGLTASTAYQTRVRAYDAAGNRSIPITGTFSTTAAPDTTAPVMSGSLSVTAITNNGATVSWAAANDNVAVTGYEYSIDGGSSYSNFGLNRELPLTGLPSDTNISLRIRAYDAAGNRSAPLSATFKTLASSTPGQPMFTRSVSRTVKAKPAPQSSEGGAFWKRGSNNRLEGSIDPNATIDVTFDWTEVLEDIQDSISSIQFDLTGLTDKGGFRDGNFATIFVSNANGTPSITCRITTSSTPARVEDRTVYFKVEQQ